MVKEHGQTWSIISKELERTPENCRDKFREIGSVNPEKRKKGKWELEELLELIRIVNKYNDTEFVKRSVIWEYKEVDSLTFKKNPTEKEKQFIEKGYKKKKNTLYLYREFELRDIADFLVTEPEDVPKNDLNWKAISNEMVSHKPECSFYKILFIYIIIDQITYCWRKNGFL